MTATGWSVSDIARVAGVTSSAVSQWIGNGKGKQSKSIGSVSAALRLERESGFSWLWLAQGKGQKLAVQPEAPRPQADQLGRALEVLAEYLLKADKNTRLAVEPLLSSLANEPEDGGKKSQLILRLLVTERGNIPTEHHVGPGHISGQLGKLDLGGKEDGRSDRAAASGSRKD